jgi:hypothetical protein
MIFPTNMANAILKEVVGCSYLFSLNADGSIDFDSLIPNPNPTPPTPENLQEKIGGALKSYLEEFMTFVIQVVVPPTMNNGGKPIPDPILSLLGAGCPLTGVLKCGGEFSCESLLPADIADGVSKLLQGSYLVVSSPSDLVPAGLPEPPVIYIPDLTPRIVAPTIDMSIPSPVINFNLPAVEFVPTNFKLFPTISVTGWPGFNLGLGAGIDATIKIGVKANIPSIPPIKFPSVELSSGGSVEIIPPSPEANVDYPLPTLPAPEISVSGLNVVFEIPDLELGDGTITVNISDAKLKVSDITVKGEDIILPDIDLSGTYSLNLNVQLNVKGEVHVKPEIVLPPMTLELDIPQIGPLAVNVGDVGPVDVEVGSFSFNLNPGMASIPFLKPIIIPLPGMAYAKNFEDIHIMDKVSIPSIRIPKILDRITKTIGPIIFPKIDLTKYGVDFSQKREWILDIEEAFEIKNPRRRAAGYFFFVEEIFCTCGVYYHEF